MQIFFELGNVQTGHAGIGVEVIHLQLFLILEQQIMHLPKSALARRGLRCFGGLLGEGMFVDEREVPKNEPQTVFEATA